MSDLSESLRAVMRGWPTGVAVVTSTFNGISHGMTVNSLASVSLDPPIITLSLANQSRTWALVTSSQVLAVTMLDVSQKHIADVFAGKVAEEDDRFKGLETTKLVSGAPLLKAGRAHLDCKVLHMIPLHNSTLFVAEVIAAEGDLDRLPLLYLNRDYRQVIL